MGLIDVLTQYDARKKAAHAAKTVKHGVRPPCPPCPPPKNIWNSWGLLGVSPSSPLPMKQMGGEGFCPHCWGGKQREEGWDEWGGWGV